MTRRRTASCRRLLLLVLVGLAASGCTVDAISPDTRALMPRDRVPAAAAESLDRAWHEGDEVAAAALADPDDPAARERLAIPARNVRALDLSEVSINPSGVGLARVSWRLTPLDRGPSQVLVRLRVTESGLAVEMTPGSPSPLWLTEPRLVTRGTGGVRVVGSPAHDLERILRDARHARRDVRSAWPAWDGRLVVEVASTQERMAAALGRPEASYDAIAAVTSTSDGSRGLATPVHVFVNPLVYAGMSAPAARIVMTHEVIHVATRAPVGSVPLWWAEGLAEYVGFSAVESSATRRLRAAVTRDLVTRIAREGLPRDLPGRTAFEGPQRNAAYASARIAVAVLVDQANRSGTNSARALSRFQVLLESGTGVRPALRTAFDIRIAEFLRRWRVRMLRLTGTGSGWAREDRSTRTGP